MSRIELASEVGDDLDRILDDLARYEVEDPASRIREIVEAINVLETNPLIGRPAPAPARRRPARRHCEERSDAAVQRTGWPASTSRDTAENRSGNHADGHLERLATPWIASLRSQ